jgi:hypothetical protein
MAATTISRATWTDGASPTGTLINNARLQADVYDKIDALIAGNLTFGGTVSSEAFGTHSISAGGTGDQVFRVRNTSAGTTNRAWLAAGNDAGEDRSYLLSTSSTYTPSGSFIADGTVLVGQGAGGMSINASNASGAIRLYTGGSGNARVTVSASDGGATFSGAGGITISNTYPVCAFYNSGGGSNEKLWRFVNNASNFYLGAVNDAGDAETVAITVARSGTTVGAITLGGTSVRFPSGTAAAPSITFSSATTSGLYWSAGTQELHVALDGALRINLRQSGILIEPRAAGTGAVAGSNIEIAQNTSGSGAAGTLRLRNRSGVPSGLWVEAGLLRVGSSFPTESDSVSHTSGTVVGDQTSTLAAKTLLGQPHDADLLAAVLGTPVHHFRYKDGRYNGETFTGIVTDESPHFGKDEGRALNEINGLGYLIGAVRALAGRLAALETP